VIDGKIVLEYDFRDVTIADREFLLEVCANEDKLSTIANFIRVLEVAQKHTKANIYDSPTEYVIAIVEGFLTVLKDNFVQLSKGKRDDR